MDETITITFSEAVENHKGMEIIGNKVSKGFTRKELKRIAKYFKSPEYRLHHIYSNNDVKVNKYDLNRLLPEELNLEPYDSAYIIVVRNAISGLELENLTNEINGLSKYLNNVENIFIEEDHIKNIYFLYDKTG